MSKGLEALEMMDMTVDIICSDEYHEAKKIVEKELKALEIIKDKKVNVGALLKLFNHEKGLEIYNSNCKEELTKDEFDSLKEVLS